MEVFLIPLFLILGIIIGFFVGKKMAALQAEKLLLIVKDEVNGLLKDKTYLKKEIEDKTIAMELAILNTRETIAEIEEKSKIEIEKLRINKDELIDSIRNQKETINIHLEKEKAQNKILQSNLENNKSEIEKLQEKFTKEFENLANKILEEKTKKFTVQNQENLVHILAPLQDKIQLFEKRVENTSKENIQHNATLLEKIKGLNDLNQQMSRDAINLTKALKGDNKTQGNWGEMILERVLEKSGLEKGREYELEKSFDTDIESKTRLRPDVIIHLPENRKMIIDSKVTLTAYEKLINVTDQIQEKQYVKEHLLSLTRHIEQLSAKKYSELYQIESPDFVLLFIPIEPAFALALEHDNDLYNKAFVKNIVIVTPSTLLATLRTIESMWKNEKQQRNALEIASQATRLYEQFVSLTDELLKLGKQLKTVESTYETSMKKLTGRGNLIVKIEQLKSLGIKTNSKEFNQKLLDRVSDEA